MNIFRVRLPLLFATLSLSLAAIAQSAEAPNVLYDPHFPPLSNNYPLTADSQHHDNVPAGKLFSFLLTDSKIFPSTSRTITVYIPAAYNSKNPACLYIGLDGFSHNNATALDNLIAQHAVPVMIGVGVSSGEVKPLAGEGDPRYDRSFEFDSRNDRLARFILQEVLPEVIAHKTPDGDLINISPDPNDHVVVGGSTGGIAAFNLAFRRPDAFRRVYMSIGTFVGMRGGEQFYVEVRKTEPKPIRVFMEDGTNDQWPGGPEMGDWFMSNFTMSRALEFAGYDEQHAWGAHNHNGKMSDELFPAALRWLWHDYPTPLTAQLPGNPRLKEILLPKEAWQPTTTHPDFANNRITRANGDIYETTPAGELWLTHSNGKKLKLDDNIKGAYGLAVEPDGNFLLVAQSHSHLGLSYRILPDGTVDSREPLFQFQVNDNDPTDPDDPATGSIVYDVLGHAYAATNSGVQIFDRNGRVIGILPLPANDPATALTFGTTDPDTLYVSSASGKLYKRKLQLRGYPQSAPPIKVPHVGGG